MLTIGQRCADWFLLRKLRLTGTLFSLYLFKPNHFRLTVIAAPSEDSSDDEDDWSEDTSKKTLDKLASSWSSNSRSTESMCRGTYNEDPALKASGGMDFVVDCFKCEMIELN